MLKTIRSAVSYPRNLITPGWWKAVTVNTLDGLEEWGGVFERIAQSLHSRLPDEWDNYFF